MNIFNKHEEAFTMSKLKKDFITIIENLNKKHICNIKNILIEMQKIYPDIKKNSIESLLHKMRYHHFKGFKDFECAQGIYIKPLFIYNFLIRDAEIISNKFSKLIKEKELEIKSTHLFEKQSMIKKQKSIIEKAKKDLEEENLILQQAFSIHYIKIYKMPLFSYTTEREHILYRIKIKFYNETQHHLPKICDSIFTLPDNEDKIESLEDFGNNLILTTMNENFALYVNDQLLSTYYSLWKNSKSYTATNSTFDFKYPNEYTEYMESTLKDRFIDYLEKIYPSKNSQAQPKQG